MTLWIMMHCRPVADRGVLPTGRRSPAHGRDTFAGHVHAEHQLALLQVPALESEEISFYTCNMPVAKGGVTGNGRTHPGSPLGNRHTLQRALHARACLHELLDERRWSLLSALWLAVRQRASHRREHRLQALRQAVIVVSSAFAG